MGVSGYYTVMKFKKGFYGKGAALKTKAIYIYDTIIELEKWLKMARLTKTLRRNIFIFTKQILRWTKTVQNKKFFKK